jgi:hypothetical protein
VGGNDLILGEELACFPILSRTVCELMGSICPSEYIRTALDNHIFDIFKRLAPLGHNRIIYLKDVIFEHLNYEETKNGKKYGLKLENSKSNLLVTLVPPLRLDSILALLHFT